MLSTLFERCMKRRGVKETDPYDWEKLEGGVPVSNMSSQNNMPSNIQSHIQVKTDQIHGGACMNSTGVIGVIATGNATTIGATNASGIEYVSFECWIVFVCYSIANVGAVLVFLTLFYYVILIKHIVYCIDAG